MPGLVVIEINPTGQAAKSGIRLHDVLYKYNGDLLNSVTDLISPRTIKVQNDLLVIRGKELLNFIIPGGSLGVSIVPYPILDVNIVGVGEVLARFQNEDSVKTREEKESRKLELMRQIVSIKSTTTPSLEGYRITQHLGIITAEYVAGVNLIREFFADVTDAIGGRSGALQMELREMRESCLINLKQEAHSLGANAIVGVDLDYSEISGGGKSMLFLVASGTAVIVAETGQD
jgi:uncharacterized protein YbjQ (UPF0145 family)